MLQRIYAIFIARNREFLRDRGTLAWNLALPLVLMIGLSLAFSGDGRDQFTVGVLQETADLDIEQHPFLETRFINFVAFTDEATAFRKIERHQLDLLVSFDAHRRYWINPDSPKAYFAERLLLQANGTIDGSIEKAQITGDAIRYVDWVLPGILGMNMMFSCLFGVGYVVVRYRKNGFLKRLRATPLTSFEFIAAQVSSRMVLILLITSFIYTGTHMLLDTRMEGSYFTLLLIAIVGALSLISKGLVVSARVTSEERAGGLLNLINWPMMMLSGVWFSLEGAHPLMQKFALLLPLTHITEAARAIMIDGDGLIAIADHLLMLGVSSIILLWIGARIFRWE